MNPQVLQVSETPMCAPDTFVDPNIKHIPCPVCGYKRAVIEEYDQITSEGRFRIRQIRCQKTPYDPMKPMAKRSGCGMVSIIDRVKIGKEVEMSRPGKITERDIEDMTRRMEAGEVKRDIFREYADRYGLSVSGVSGTYYYKTKYAKQKKEKKAVKMAEPVNEVAINSEPVDQINGDIDSFDDDEDPFAYADDPDEAINPVASEEAAGQKDNESIIDYIEVVEGLSLRKYPVSALLEVMRRICRSFTVANILDMPDDIHHAVEVLAR